jgi:uncharacterized membrane protein
MATKNKQQPTDYKGIAMVIIAIGALYILATNIVAAIASMILLVIIIIVGAYFILPRLGITVLASLLGGLGKK